MAGGSKRKTKYLESQRVARAVFAGAEAVGLTEREALEKLTTRFIEELRGQVPVDSNRATKAFLLAADSMDLIDRMDKNILDELGGQVVERLGLAIPLPGLEPIGLRAPISYGQGAAPSDYVSNVTSNVERDAIPRTIKEEKPMVVHTRSGSDIECGPELKLTKNAITVLRKRYLQRDSNGEVIETPEEMFHRVARCVAAAELNYDAEADIEILEEEFYRLMTNLEFLPNSPTLMNAGRELGQLSACFVLPVEDSMESIFDAVKYTALIHKSGGGTGFSFSSIRPKGDTVGSTGGVASGPVSFMRAFDSATDVIKQGGMRRGANMAILRVDHPDILEFIAVKGESKVLTNFNLSVAVDTNFFKAVEGGGDYNLVNPRDGKIAGYLNARDVFDKIVDTAWRTGDPGIVFIDRINMYNPTPNLGDIESTNPCGEQPLLPYESCNLGSVNLSKMIVCHEERAEIDYVRLAKTVHKAVHFLDNVIDVNKFPLPEIKHMTTLSRKIGLGVMGFADMLIQLQIPYGSEESISIAEKIMRFVSEEANKASVELAKKRGIFPAYNGSAYDVEGGIKVRNASRTTIAPTGSLSIVAGCSSGIEPVFALSYVRNVLDGEQLVEVNPYFEEVAKGEGFYSTDLMCELAQGTHLREKDGKIPDWVKEVFVTAHDIEPEQHVKIQSAFQKYTDNAVSKTVNLPQDATKDDIANIYMMAFRERLKGITIYRDKSKETQVLSIAGIEETVLEEILSPRRRPKVTRGITERVTTGCGHLYITVNFDEEGICEVFTSLGKAGGCASAQLEATGRLISLALRSGLDKASVIKHLRGIRCPSISWEDGRSVLSCADAIGSVLERYLEGENQKPYIGKQVESHTGIKSWAGQCPDCGGMLAFQEGCYLCHGCGYTRC